MARSQGFEQTTPTSCGRCGEGTKARAGSVTEQSQIDWSWMQLLCSASCATSDLDFPQLPRMLPRALINTSTPLSEDPQSCKEHHALDRKLVMDR